MIGEHREHRVQRDAVIDPCRLSRKWESEYLGDSRLEELRGEFGYHDFEESRGICAHGGVA